MVLPGVAMAYLGGCYGFAMVIRVFMVLFIVGC